MRDNTMATNQMQELQTDPLTGWKKEPTVLDLQDDMAVARQWNQDHTSKVQEWLAARNIEGKHKPKAAKNRSTVQPKLVRRQAEWRYPALSEPFLSSEEMFKVSPVTWEDVDAARQNQLVLNSQFRTKLDPVNFIDEYVRTTVDEGTCFVRLGWCRETKMQEVEAPVWTYVEIPSAQHLEALQQALLMMRDNPQGFEELPLEMQKAAEYAAETGKAVVAGITGTEMVEEEVIVKNHPTVEVIDYENVFLDPTCKGNIDNANFMIISFETSKAKLMKDGRYKNLDKVVWSSQTPLHQPDHATTADDSVQFKDELRKNVVAYEYWGMYDIHGTGELVPIVATWIGNTMIRMEENPYPDQELPFVAVPYLPVKGQVTGEADAELLGDNQAIMGAVTRGMIDLMGRSANGQTGHAKGMLDVVNKRKFQAGEDYEYNPTLNPAIGVHQHTYPEIPASALNMLAIQNQEAESLTGVKAFSGGLSGEAYGEVAAGIRGLLDAAAKREMSILRRLAQGMEKIGRKIIAMNGAFLSEEEVVQITNDEFVTVSREDLIGEFNLKVDIATAEVDAAKAEDLTFMLQTMGPSVDFSIVQILLVQLARLKRMPELAHQLENYEPQPDPIEEKRKELEVAKLELELQEIQSKIRLNQAKAEGEMADARKDNAEADRTDLDYVEQETGTTHARDMDKLAAQAEANQNLEITKKILTPSEPGEDKNREISDAIGHQAVVSALT